jgi:hypothetical protein
MNDGAQFLIAEEPYYRPVGDELVLFEAANAARIPVMLKGPTGCGKTRFVDYMAWKLQRPLITGFSWRVPREMIPHAANLKAYATIVVGSGLQRAGTYGISSR